MNEYCSRHSLQKNIDMQGPSLKNIADGYVAKIFKYCFFRDISEAV